MSQKALTSVAELEELASWHIVQTICVLTYVTT